METDQIKQRFGIIGNNALLNRAIEIARQVAGTDLSVLVTGESGVGKEFIPQIIHQNSPRKHAAYIAVNCGAIPEGTIDSELFGHEKGSFTGANETRKGYFEVADGGTIFLDEVAELPLSTQVRLLRVLQTGEFLKVGSSKVQKCNVRVVAATNVNLHHAINTGKFREDLYYRLNTVPIVVPALRERKEDIYLLFRKFALDFADKYKMPVIKLTEEAQTLLENYRWPGNVRQLKNVAEQMSVLEQNRLIHAEILKSYLPSDGPSSLPATTSENGNNADYMSERDILFKIILQLRKDVEELQIKINRLEHSEKSAQPQIVHLGEGIPATEEYEEFTSPSHNLPLVQRTPEEIIPAMHNMGHEETAFTEKTEEENLSIHETSSELIKKALEKHGGKRKAAARELGISERTLYRKIKDLK